MREVDNRTDDEVLSSTASFQIACKVDCVGKPPQATPRRKGTRYVTHTCAA